MANLLGEAIGLLIGDTTINVSIHEYNAGALVLVDTLPPQFNPQIKHYASTNIWFCEYIHKLGVKLNNITTMNQLGAILLRALQGVGLNTFVRICWYGRYMGEFNNALERDC